MLQYIQQHGDFEKPTAQIFYKKMASATGIEVKWDHAKFKMRYIKTKFDKAENWLKSTGAGVEDTGATTIKGKLMEICPFYEELTNIFSKGKQHSNLVVESTSFDCNSLCDLSPTTASVDFSQMFTNESTSITHYPPRPSASSTPKQVSTQATSEHQVEPEVSQPSVASEPELLSAQATAVRPSPAKRSSIQGHIIRQRQRPSNSLAELTRIEEQRDNFRREKMALEKEKFEFQREIEMKKIQLEEEKLRAQVAMHKNELESKERIAKYELDLKYSRQNL